MAFFKPPPRGFFNPRSYLSGQTDAPAARRLRRCVRALQVPPHCRSPRRCGVNTIIIEPASSFYRSPTTHKAASRAQQTLGTKVCDAQGAGGGRRVRPGFPTDLEPSTIGGTRTARGHPARDLHLPISQPRASLCCRLPLHRLMRKYARRERLSARNPSIQSHYRPQARGGPAERSGRRAASTCSCSRPSVGWRSSRSTRRRPRRP